MNNQQKALNPIKNNGYFEVKTPWKFEDDIKNVLKSGGTGLYDIEFKKVDDLSFEETDLHIGKAEIRDNGLAPNGDEQ